MDLMNKNILLTGATGGLGLELAKLLINKGANLLCIGRNSKNLNELSLTLKPQLMGDSHQLETLVADISEHQGQQNIVNYYKNAEFDLDILINNAGVNEFALLVDSDATHYEEMINTNLTAPIKLTHALLPLLLKNKSATIVNIGSILGSLGLPGYAVYSASKYGLRGFSEALRRELAESPINVLYFAPRAISTKMNSSEVTAMNKELGANCDEPSWVAQQLIDVLEKGKRNQKLIGSQENFFTRLNSFFPNLVDKALKSQLKIVKKYSKQHYTNGEF